MMPANRSNSAECRVGSAAISPTSPGSAARAAGVVRKTIERRDHFAQVLGQRSGVGNFGRGADREHRLVHEVRFARPAPVDRGLAGAGPLGDRGDQEPGIAGFGEKLDRGAQHRAVDSRVTGSAKINNHYETQSNISRVTDAVRLDDLAEPRFSAEAQQILDMMAAMAPHCPLDADALHAQASADTGLHDFGPDDYRERLDVYLAALREIDGLHEAGVVNFYGQLLQLLKNRLLLTDLLSRHPEIDDIELRRRW